MAPSPAAPETKQTAQNTAHLLIAAIRDAINSTADRAAISQILSMALSATGSDQGPGFRMCVRSLRELIANAPASGADL